MPRRQPLLCKVIRHGLFWPDRKLRLFEPRARPLTGTDPHDRVVVDGPVRRLAGPIEHDSYRDFADHVRTVDRFSRIAARAMRSEGRRFLWSDSPSGHLRRREVPRGEGRVPGRMAGLRAGRDGRLLRLAQVWRLRREWRAKRCLGEGPPPPRQLQVDRPRGPGHPRRGPAPARGVRRRLRAAGVDASGRRAAGADGARPAEHPRDRGPAAAEALPPARSARGRATARGAARRTAVRARALPSPGRPPARRSRGQTRGGARADRPEPL